MGNRPREVHSDAAWRAEGLREGFTTGACAAASAAAAARALLTGHPQTAITIDLPVREGVTFELARCEMGDDGVLCGVIKDAGDDPDVTHGAEIQAYVSWAAEPGLALAGGEGVGRVTLPGLPIPPGEPAINPVPRRMIARSVAQELGDLLESRGLRVEVRVPGGEVIAEETLNPRLGIVGGISILGTTGIVKPYSTSAYRASIYLELKVARENGIRTPVLTTGTRSEEYAMARYPDLPEYAYVQVGDHMDYALKQCRRLGFERVTISSMIGKTSKLAQGRMQTHVSQGGIDNDFLVAQARALGAGDALVERIHTANTAHHVQVLMQQAGLEGLEPRLAQMAADAAAAFIDHAFRLEVLLYHIQGELLGVGVAE